MLGKKIKFHILLYKVKNNVNLQNVYWFWRAQTEHLTMEYFLNLFFQKSFYWFHWNPIFMIYRFGVLKDEKTRVSQINQKYFVKPRSHSKNQIKTTKPNRKYQNQRTFEKDQILHFWLSIKPSDSPGKNKVFVQF